MNKTDYPRKQMRDAAAAARRDEREWRRICLRINQGSGDLCASYFKGLFTGYKCAEIALEALNHLDND